MLKNNLISILDLSKQQQKSVFDLANHGKLLFSEYNHALDDKVLGTFFFQPSTRTQFSFQSAFVRLGGHYIGCSEVGLLILSLFVIWELLLVIIVTL